MNNSQLKVLVICGFFLTSLVVSPVFGRPVDSPRKNYVQLELPELKELSDEEQEEDTGEKQTEKVDTNPKTNESTSEKTESLKADSAAMKQDYQQQIDRLEKEIKQLEGISATMRDTISAQKTIIDNYADTVSRLKSDSRQMRRVIKKLRGDTPPESSPDTKPVEKSDTQQKKKQDTKEVDPSKDIPFEEPLNPNEASLEELQKIDELSDRLAERIQWYRDVVRRFNSREDLRRVPGIGEDLYEKIKHYFLPGSYE